MPTTPEVQAGDAEKRTTEDQDNAKGSPKERKQRWQEQFCAWFLGEWRRSDSRLEVLLQSALLGLTLLALVLGHRQLVLMRETMETEQRAWVLPDWDKLDKFFASDQAIGLVVTNFGRSPAFNLRAKWGVLEGTELPTSDPPCSDPAPVGPLLAPDRYDVIVVTLSPKLQGIRKAVGVLTVSYEDAFGKTHHTKFSFHTNRDLTPAVGKRGTHSDAN